MIVRDFMTKNPFYTNPKEQIYNVKSVMDREKFSKVPVLDDSGKLVGVVTKTDLKKAMPSEATTLDIYELSYLLSKITVEKVMKKDPITVQMDATIEEAAKIMSEKGLSSLVVMDGEVLTGILSKSDLFKALVNMFGLRYEGVRASLEVSDDCGMLAKISSAIAEKNGKIVSFITADGSDASKRIITFKILGLDKETVRDILSKVGGEIKDIR